jgi:hypothetical protein
MLRPLSIALFLLAGGCLGAVGEAGGARGRGPTDSPIPRGTCDESARGRSEPGVRRFTTPEVVASLGAIFGDDTLARPEIARSLTALPAELALSTSQRELDGSIRDVEGLLAVAEAIAAAVVADGALAVRVLGCDPTAIEACRAALLDRLAPRMFRRPLYDEERAEYTRFMTDLGAAGLEWAIVRLVVSPHFHQHLEIEGTDADHRIRLAPFEVASRIAYRITGGPPDDALLDAARSGALETVEDARAHATRLLATSGGHARVQEVLARWLGLERVSDPDPAVASALGIEPGGLGAEARQELERFVDHTVFVERGSFVDLMSKPTAFAFTPRLATLYRLEISDAPQTFADARGGILLRSATLLSGRRYTDPIMRGSFLRRRVLCHSLPTPDPVLVASRDDLRAELTHERYPSREIVTRLTEGATCMACHEKLNPLGFALERFGTAGEVRASELVFDVEGDVIGEHPIDTAVSDLAIAAGAETAASGPAELVRAVAESEDTRLCFATQLFAQTRMRFPSDEDVCLVRDVESALAEGLPVADAVVRSVANEDLFYRRAAEGP